MEAAQAVVKGKWQWCGSCTCSHNQSKAPTKHGLVCLQQPSKPQHRCPLRLRPGRRRSARQPSRTVHPRPRCDPPGPGGQRPNPRVLHQQLAVVLCLGRRQRRHVRRFGRGELCLPLRRHSQKRLRAKHQQRSAGQTIYFVVHTYAHAHRGAPARSHTRTRPQTLIAA